MSTRIYSCGKGMNASQLIASTHVDVDYWFPETIACAGLTLPLIEQEQVKLLPSLLGTTIMTLSPIIIRLLLREVRLGRLDDLELYCDGRRIAIAKDGSMIDHWDGGFFETGFHLLFD